MAIKQKPQPSFMEKKTPKPPAPPKARLLREGGPIEPPDIRPIPPVDQVSPRLFLAVNGFDQVHEGQRFPGTYEEVINLLQEYKAL